MVSMNDKMRTPDVKIPALVILLVAVTILGSSCGKPLDKARQETSTVTALISAAQGGVRVRAAGTDAWLAVSEGTAICEGDTLQTEAQGKLNLIFADGARAGVNENSILRIDPQIGKKTGIEVTRGDVWVEKKPDLSGMELTTPAAVARPAGPGVGLKVEPGGTSSLTVTKGSARFSNELGSVLVARSEQSTTVPGQPPGVPSLVETGGINSWKLGYDSYVKAQIDPYFSTVETRDNAESEARSKISTNPIDAWSHLNLARALIDDGNRVEAKAEFGRALELDPQFSQAHSGLGKVALMESRWDDAAAAYAQARRADRESVEALYGMGQAALGKGDLEAATKWYKEALELEPEDAKSLTALGVVKWLAGDLESAIDDFREVVTNDPSLARAYRNLGNAYSLQRQPGLARNNLEKAVRRDLRDYPACNCLGIDYLRREKWDDASRCFRQLTDADGVWIQAVGYENLGVAKELSGDLPGALNDLLSAAGLAPGEPCVFVNLGQAQILLSQGDAGLSSLSRAVELDEENWYTHLALSYGYWSLGKTDQACAEARRSIELDPSAWQSHILLGLCLEKQGAADEGKQEIKTARRLVPERNLSPTDHVLLGNAFAAQKKYDDALDEYREASKLASGMGVYHRFTGDVLLQMKRGDDALKEYRKAVELTPGDAAARVSLAESLHAEKELDLALKELEQAVKDNPSYVSALVLLAEYLLEDGDVEGALSQLTAAKAVPGTPSGVLAAAAVVTGNACDKKEDYNAAIAAYREAITLDGTRGDAWFYLAGDLERTGNAAEAKTAYQKALELCRGRAEWEKFYEQAAEKSGRL